MRLMRGAYAGAAAASASATPGSSSNVTPADLDLVPGLEALRLERPQHADPPQPPLEVGHRVLVLDVVALRAAARCPGPGPRTIRAPALHREALRRAAGRNTMCSASSCSRPARPARRRSAPGVGSRALGRLTPRAPAPQQLARQLAQPRAGRARGGEHGHLGPEPPLPLARPPSLRALRRSRGRPWTAPAPAAAAPGARRARQLALDRRVVARRVGPALAREISGAMSSTCTSRRVRSTCARKSCPRPAPSLAPSIRPGMSATTSWRSSPSSTPEHRLERRERVVGDLRRGPRQPREQRGLARVGQPHETDVRQQLQLQLEPSLLSGRPRSAKRGAWRVGGREALVAPAPGAPAARPSRAARAPAAPSGAPRGRPPRRGVAADRLGARRHPQRSGLAVGAVALRAFAVPAAPGPVVRAAPEALQVAQRVVAHEHHVAPAPAVAAVGAAARDVGLAAEARRSRRRRRRPARGFSRGRGASRAIVTASGPPPLAIVVTLTIKEQGCYVLNLKSACHYGYTQLYKVRHQAGAEAQPPRTWRPAQAASTLQRAREVEAGCRRAAGHRRRARNAPPRGRSSRSGAASRARRRCRRARRWPASAARLRESSSVCRAIDPEHHVAGADRADAMPATRRPLGVLAQPTLPRPAPARAAGRRRARTRPADAARRRGAAFAAHALSPLGALARSTLTTRPRQPV